jgi:hypothetical protein
MAKSLDSGDALMRVVHEDFLQQIGKLLVECGVLIDGLLRPLSILDSRVELRGALHRASSSP